jgi:hypothetical protein
MAAQTPPYVLQSAAHSAELFRRELMSGLPPGSAGGVVPATVVVGQANPGDLQVSAPTSGMSVLVAPGQAIVPGTLGSGAGYGMPIGYGYPQITLNGASVPTLKTAATQVQLTTQGAYYCYNDNSTGKVPLTIAAANASNPRIDVVGIQVSDSQYSGSTNSWALTVVAGTAAASPVVPTFPANFLPLALVWVPAAASSIVAADIVDLRVSFNRNPYRAKMYNSGAQSFAAQNTGANVVYNSTEFDPSGMGTPSTGLFTAPVSGLYAFTSTTYVNAPNGGTIIGAYFRNSAEAYRYGVVQPANGVSITLSGAYLAAMNVGDTMAVNLYNQTTGSGGAIGLGGFSTLVGFEAVLLAPL